MASTILYDCGDGVCSNSPKIYLARNMDIALVGSSSGYIFMLNSSRASRKQSKVRRRWPLEGLVRVKTRSTSVLPMFFARPGVSLHMRQKDELSMERASGSDRPLIVCCCCCIINFSLSSFSRMEFS